MSVSGPVMAVKLLANIAEKCGRDEVRVLRRVFDPRGKRVPRWLPQLMADLGGRPVRRGRRVTVYEIPVDTIMHQYKLVTHPNQR